MSTMNPNDEEMRRCLCIISILHTIHVIFVTIVNKSPESGDDLLCDTRNNSKLNFFLTK